MKYLIVMLFILSSCAWGYAESPHRYISKNAALQANEIYDPWKEKAFCANDMGIWNVIEGGVMTVEIPLCKPGDIVFHTHPVWAESFPNVIDVTGWMGYQKQYGNKHFGIMFGTDKFEVYELNQ